MLGRESLINHVRNHLLNKGFVRSDDKFTRNFRFVRQTPTMIINGQAIRSEPEEIITRIEIELMGPGGVYSDDGRVEEFELIRFAAVHKDQTSELSTNVYFNEPGTFDNYLKQIFGL